MEPSSAVDWMATAVASSVELEDFESVVRLHWLKVFRFALASLRDRHAAESLAQDCFVKAYRARESFRGEASVSTWLMQIAVNLVRDRVRDRRWQFWRRARQSAVDVTAAAGWIRDGGASPEDAALKKEQVQAVLDATASLSERQRTVFLLRFVEDMDLLEIAAATGLKEGTVKIHLFRAVQAVRTRIGRAK
jgi:RNA polymerase sigma-70 factor (ECF subfamily)